jgi:hypothetical protein
MEPCLGYPTLSQHTAAKTMTGDRITPLVHAEALDISTRSAHSRIIL